ncbi:hypothetical protein QEH59_17745 [Coraliomargarita sp. SDUM461004]|uniref:DUF4065 domain-containing protein n=1 Tax=Thalassobacterium sedimentorum TaxID=3041258 RepID=A0ABU1ARQ1_9BACT|nr:hypothetical protein [Coraliomargarita sp. SDUM461004]MDQ8196283.1 hypothetical protein [Coraliomargarita sp. SDUM461004]
MNDQTTNAVFIPDSVYHARSVLNGLLAQHPKPEYSNSLSLLKIWHCIAYLNPGLHPDEIDNPQGGWPAQYIPYASAIWKLHDTGEINDDQLYPADAQWAGLCDQLDELTPEEAERRKALCDAMSVEPIYQHILEMIDTREAQGRISVFYTHRDSKGPYVPRPRADKTDCAADRTKMLR